jgi:hypothetical protein
MHDVNVKNGFIHIGGAFGRCSKRRSRSCPPVMTKKISKSTPPPDAFKDDTTTIMVRNIPTRFTAASLLDIVAANGFPCSVDFIYLPMDYRTGKNMGYGFINFIQPFCAWEFACLFHNCRLGSSASKKVLEIAPSRTQGLRENVKLFRDSDVVSCVDLIFYKPLVMSCPGGPLEPLRPEIVEYILETY